MKNKTFALFVILTLVLGLTGCGEEKRSEIVDIEVVSEEVIDYSQIDIFELMPTVREYVSSEEISETVHRERSYYRANIDDLVPEEEVINYIDACQEAGFTEISRYYEHDGTIMFRATTPDGIYEVSINRSDGSNQNLLIIFEPK